MSARGLVSLGLVLLLAVGCESGAGQQMLSTIGSATGIPGLGAAGQTLGAVPGAFTDLEEAEEIELGRSVTAAIGARYKVLRDPQLTRYVALVGNTVANVSDRPDMKYYFAVLDSEDINALAAPGGYILITRGALRLMNDEATLAGVLGHEVGHIALRHHNETIKAEKRKQLAVGAGQTALSFTSVGAFAGLIGAMTDAMVEQVLLKGFSRAEEMASDKVGFEYATRAGYDPAGLREFLNALATRGARDAGVAKFNSTHPGTDDRLKEQTKLLDAKKGTGKREAARFARAMGR